MKSFLTDDQLEFIADNYYNPEHETNSLFTFKLNTKKKNETRVK